MNVLVVGLGKIGKPLLEIVKGTYNGFGLDVQPKEVKGKIDIMHICFPYTVSFVSSVVEYIQRFQPKLTLIESTVPPTTTEKIYSMTKVNICHSPFRGRVADGFKWCYHTYTKFIGSATAEAARMADKYYRSLGFKTRICKSPLETEFMKLINTTYYGLLIAWFQEVERVIRRFNLDKEDVIEFIRSTEKDSGGKVARPVYRGGYIGGHCIIPNVLLLKKIYPSKFIDVLLESNERRKEELAHV